MYTPQHFAFDDPDELFAFVDANSFGTLITTARGELSVSRVPFLVDRQDNCLYGHVARNNPQWQRLEAADDLLVTFDGAHAYISPTWYATPDLVPTWNYVTVTVRGSATLMTSPDELWPVIAAMSQRFEAGRAPAWDPESLPAARREALLGAIVGFRVAVEEIAGKRKLSQNRSRDDIEGAIRHLRSEPGPGAGEVVADAMVRALDTRPGGG